ncbi:DMT family transporter [Ferruginivarius sediminum]|uniref:DMT family transporter n=1 Tax=Ferruginivarius sediminum TaxID=2661937 RepID=A0A369TDJ7_9PROT|nr:DMT family transporter [Ferruginivarius sediminum]RDD63421.1 DMT family transporter [Ferruginivarius sediminum]
MTRTDQAPATAARQPVTARGAYLLLGAIVLLWGANWPVMKVALDYVPPLWFVAARLLMGLVTLAAILVASGRFILPRRGDIPVVISVGLLQMAGFLGFVNIGLQEVDAGRSAILAYTTPLWVTPAAILLLGERLNWRKGLGLLLGLAGVAVLFNPLNFDWSDTEKVTHNAVLMLAALCWAGAILHIRGHRWISSPLQLAPWQMAVGSVPLLIAAWAFEGPPTVEWSPGIVAAIAYNGPLATAFCFWASVTVSRSLPAISTSLSLLGVPAAGMLLAAVTLGEMLSLTRLGGFALILGGLAMVQLTDLARSGGAR